MVTSLTGFLVSLVAPGGRLRRAAANALSPPLLLLAVAAVASTTVWGRVDQVQRSYGSAYLHALFTFAVRQYFFQPDPFWGVLTTTALIEGLALYVAVVAACQMELRFANRLRRMLVVGGTGLGLMSVYRLEQIRLRDPGVLQVLRATYAGLRISPQIPDYIAAGAYFALCWLIAIGSAVATPRRRMQWIAVSLPILSGLYLTGSRSVIGAAAVGFVFLFAIVGGSRRLPIRGIAASGLIALIAMFVSFPYVIGHDVLGATAEQSFIVRRELFRTGLRVIAAHPLFGVGVDRFFVWAGSLASPTLNALWYGRKNPHNDFIRFGAELGVIGLGLFVWILLSAGRCVWRTLWATRDARYAGVAAGLLAFLITCVFSNPLMVHDVSYAFWITLGLAVGDGKATLQASHTQSRWFRWPQISKLRWPIAAAFAAILLASVPLRAAREVASLHLAGITYGLFSWGTDTDGTRCRLSGPRVTIFVDGRARLIHIPLKGTLPGASQLVDIEVDGRLANQIAVDRMWQRVTVIVPDEAPANSRRIELIVSPTWVPAKTFPADTDDRELGVLVGMVTVDQ